MIQIMFNGLSDLHMDLTKNRLIFNILLFTSVISQTILNFLNQENEIKLFLTMHKLIWVYIVLMIAKLT